MAVFNFVLARKISALWSHLMRLKFEMPGKQGPAMIKFELIDLNLIPNAVFLNQLSSFGSTFRI